jgi:multicomponent Na+:H+ antiporter subunit C
MDLVLAIVIAALFATGLYTILRRSIVRLAIGLVLIGHAANLVIFTAAGLRRDGPPILPPGGLEAAEGGFASADPLPQALVLTAIVIGFAVLAFTLVLVHRVYLEVRSDDVDALAVTDHLPDVRASMSVGDEPPPDGGDEGMSGADAEAEEARAAEVEAERHRAAGDAFDASDDGGRR